MLCSGGEIDKHPFIEIQDKNIRTNNRHEDKDNADCYQRCAEGGN